MSRDIENFINNCQICDACEVHNSKERLLKHEVPNKVGIDLFVFKGIDYLVLLDYSSKFVVTEKIKFLNILRYYSRSKRYFFKARNIRSSVF